MFQHLARLPQADSVPVNAAASKVPRWVHQNVDQVYQWLQMMNSKYILKKKLLESLDEKYFKGHHQAYIDYTNCTLEGLIHHPYDDNGTISPMDIEGSEKNEAIMVSTRPNGRPI